MSAFAMVLRAPAKLTWGLRVTGVRADGYHLIDAEMTSLDLVDQLVVSPGNELRCQGPFAAGVPTDEQNLVRQALTAVGRDADITIIKHIPAGGGLGGGSTDAAAVLRWAGCEDLDVAVRLGADVPFCLVGGRAHVTGIGEVVEPLPPVARIVTLVVPPLAVPTAAVYRAWDDLGGPTADGPNDLEPAALVVEPELRVWRDRIGDATGRTPVLAGSGATWFVEGDATDATSRLPGATVVVARTAGSDGVPVVA